MVDDSVISWVLFTAIAYCGLISAVVKGVREKDERKAETWDGR